MKFSPLFFALLLFNTLPVSAQQKVDQLKKIEAAIDQEIASQKSAKNDPNGERLNRGMQQREFLSRLRFALARADGSQTEELLNQIALYSSAPEVKKAVDEFTATLRREREEKDQALLRQIETARANAQAALKAATKPSDLDPVLAELGNFNDQRNNGNSPSPTLQTALSRAQMTLQFVMRWQDYLSSKQAGETAGARQTLQNLAGDNYSALGLMPRSEILARVQNIETVKEGVNANSTMERADEILSKMKTLEDVNGALKLLRKLQNDAPRNYNESLSPTISALNSIEKSYREFRAGLFTSFDLITGGSEGMAHADIIPLRMQLIMLMLPRCLNLPEDEKPLAGEAVQPFLERTLTDASQRGDTALINRIRNVQRMLLRGGNFFADSAQIFGISAFAAGQNQETAGQFALAVTSYQTALKNGGDAIPAKLIGERLAQLKAAHPAEFEQGMDIFINPPPSPYSPNDPRFPGSMSAMRARMGIPQATPPPASMVVPGEVPVPTTKASATPASSAVPSAVPSATPSATAAPRSSP